MNEKKAIKQIMDHQGVSLHQLAPRLGKSWQAIQNNLNGKAGLRIDTAAAILDALDYDIVLIPRRRAAGDRLTIDQGNPNRDKLGAPDAQGKIG